MTAKISPARRALMRNMNTVDETMFDRAQHTSSMPQVTSPAMRPESEVTRAMIQPDGRLVEVREREALQVVEHPLAQVVLDALAEDARHRDHAEDRHALAEHDQAEQQRDRAQARGVVRDDRLVDDPLVEVRVVGVGHGDRGDGHEEHERPLPVPAHLAEHAQHGPAVEPGGELLLVVEKSGTAHVLLELALDRASAGRRSGGTCPPSRAAWRASPARRCGRRRRRGSGRPSSGSGPGGR